MGIFKPNIEKLEAKKNVQSLIKALKHNDIDICLRAIEALGKLKDKSAVESLINTLNDEERDIRKKAVEVLGELGDKKAIKSLFKAMKDKDSDVRLSAAVSLRQIKSSEVPVLLYQALHNKDTKIQAVASDSLNKLGFKPEYGAAIADYLIEKKHWDQLSKLGKPAVKPLMESLAAEVKNTKANRDFWAEVQGRIDYDGYPPSRYMGLGFMDSIIKVLGKIGDKRSVSAVIDNLFEYPRISTSLLPSNFRKLFGKYADLIIDAATYTRSEEGSIWLHGLDRTYSYSTKESKKALKHLCRITSPLSNNILHKVTNKRSIEVIKTIGESGYFDRLTRLSFTNLKKMAESELARRGNPPYDPSVYLDEKSWKL